MFKLNLGKTEEPEIKLPTAFGSQKKQDDSRKTSAYASLTTLKPLTVWVTTNCGKFLKTLEALLLKSRECHPACLLRNLYMGQEATVRTLHGTSDWFKIRKGV